MGKDENVTRVDVRVPLAMYERIEVLAEKTNQPFTPKTKNTANPKRVVTPIILKLVELGLKAIDEDSSKLDEDLVTQDIDNSESIENRLFVRLEKRLEAKLDELLEARVKADTITPDIEPHSENEITSEDINSESAIEPNSEIIEVKSEAVNEDVSALEDTNDNSENDINPEDTEAKTFEDTENEIKKLSSQGLNYSQIAKNLTEGNYPTKKGSYKWSGNQVKRILEKL
ncbi:recombinase family protein [Cyanobacterium aponinum FACHB-4101]|uniref:recombinase family protein n=1 Tax=Cyanobacterium aponinum TaxID=379064 RepID=UPI0016812791|nr:recombinase family protein [Cyanobacterium aponinum]MBD2395966.1 recombinase family protein [Cyanobacterium aponinum FACHB-4101]